MWLLHILGIDTQQSWAYDFWSGVGAKIVPNPADFALALMWYHSRNCHHRGCLRIGKHSPNGTPWCTKHHPNNEEEALPQQGVVADATTPGQDGD